MENRFLFRLTALTVAMAMVVLGAGVAFADDLVADADTLTTGDQGARDLGTVAPGATLSAQVSLSLLCAGKDHLDKGQTATVSMTSATIQKSGSKDTAAATVTASSVKIGAAPATWPDDENSCPSPAPVLQDNGNSDVSITAPLEAGIYTVVLTYAKSGALSPAGTGDNNAVKKTPTATFTFTVAAPSDTTPPDTTITSAPANPTNATSASFSFTSSEIGSTFECKLETGNWTACNTGSISYAGPLSSTEHTFSVRAKDAANNQDASPASHTWTIDTTRPTGTVSINNGDAYTNSAAATLTLSASSDTSHFRKGQGADCSTVGFSNWTAYATSVSHDLGSGDGAKQVCVEFKDAAGNLSSSAASDSIVLDTTRPAGSVSINGGNAYTNVSGVTLTMTADSDTTQYQKGEGADCSSVSFSDWTAYSANVSHNLGSGDGIKNVCVKFKDAAGNVSLAASDAITLDTTKPTITASAAASKTDGTHSSAYTADTWTNKDKVTVTYSCGDGTGSGVSGTFTDSDTVDAEGTTTSVSSSETCTDNAGNTASQAASFGPIKIDRTAPSNLAFVGGPTADTYYFGMVPAAPTSCTADETLSLLTTAGCTISGYSSAVGNHTMTASATDNAGNTGTLQWSYKVLGWDVKGFYSPVDLGGVTNTAKAGSTVPLKFEIFSGSTELTDTTAIDTFTVAKATCGTAFTSEDAIETYSTGGTSLRYDATAGQFIQNWKIPTGVGICYRVTLKADDGSTTTALFKSK
ncbi:MAG TPA: PxKF domain-containing protein [Actinomycetota bacterium]|nr:PxKF domain-containing protein [Actinomycetota bacterium]